MKKIDFNTTRFATEADFRTASGTFKLNLEYYECTVYSNVWSMQISDHDTDRTFLKTKIALQLIRVPLIESYWDVKNIEDMQQLLAVS